MIQLQQLESTLIATRIELVEAEKNSELDQKEINEASEIIDGLSEKLESIELEKTKLGEEVAGLKSRKFAMYPSTSPTYLRNILFSLF